MIDGVVRAAVDKLGSKTALEYGGSDGRHTAIAALAEKGRPDWAQIGHVAPEMMKAVFLGVREEIVH